MDDFEGMLGVVADLIVDAELSGRDEPLRTFDDFVIALSLDCGLTVDQVQSMLVAKMLEKANHSFKIPNVMTLWNEDAQSVTAPKV